MSQELRLHFDPRDKIIREQAEIIKQQADRIKELEDKLWSNCWNAIALGL